LLFLFTPSFFPLAALIDQACRLLKSAVSGLASSFFLLQSLDWTFQRPSSNRSPVLSPVSSLFFFFFAAEALIRYVLFSFSIFLFFGKKIAAGLSFFFLYLIVPPSFLDFLSNEIRRFLRAPVVFWPHWPSWLLIQACSGLFGFYLSCIATFYTFLTASCGSFLCNFFCSVLWTQHLLINFCHSLCDHTFLHTLFLHLLKKYFEAVVASLHPSSFFQPSLGFFQQVWALARSMRKGLFSFFFF
jgi:hypothetical protein